MPHAELMCRLKRWHMNLSQALSELTLFWNFLAIAVVKEEDDSLLFVHGSETDLKSLQQALAFVNCRSFQRGEQTTEVSDVACRI